MTLSVRRYARNREYEYVESHKFIMGVIGVF